MLADAVLDLARDALNDSGDGTWGLDEKIRWLNQGQLWICDLKAEACAKTEAVQLVAGTRQTLPKHRTNGRDSLRFLGLVRNMGIDGATVGPVILPADMEALDRMHPGWHEDTARRVVKHYLYNPAKKTEYFVWPPVVSSPAVYVELRHVPAPTDVPFSTSRPRYIAEHHQISIPDDFAQALAEYIAWRCYAKTDDRESREAAAQHMEAFYRAIGIKAERDTQQHPIERMPYQRGEPREHTLRG